MKEVYKLVITTRASTEVYFRVVEHTKDETGGWWVYLENGDETYIGGKHFVSLTKKHKQKV
tara:strand:- start:76 stop:258 length:183 start_codon:yes stop_codon:yes gene_type:complete